MSPNSLPRRTVLGALTTTTAWALSPTAVANAFEQRHAAYFGSYGWTTPPGHGLEVGRYDTSTRKLRVCDSVEGVPNASWLTIDPTRNVLYTTNELTPEGSVSALEITDPGRPRPINSASSEGAGPTHLSLHPTGRFLLTANYNDGSVVVHRVRSDGGIGPTTDRVVHRSSTGRAHAHQVITDPTGRWVIAVDLGADTVFTYSLDTREGRLCERSKLRLPTGTGPRHLVFHPGNRYAYLLNEYASTVTILGWDVVGGHFTAHHSLSTRPRGARGENYPGEIVTDRHGESIYLTNRGDDTIAELTVYSGGADLKLRRTTPTGGTWPRHCVLAPDEGVLFVANRKSGTITRLLRDRRTGALEQPAGVTAVAGAAMLAIRT